MAELAVRIFLSTKAFELGPVTQKAERQNVDM
jgi:hypothetical protein